jgi:hypothetical protein
MMNSAIIINVTGTLRLDETTIVVNPIVTVTNANDDYLLNSVSTTSNFTSNTQNYEFSRPTGTFDYVETWSDEDVRACVEEWINEHLVVIE